MRTVIITLFFLVLAVVASAATARETDTPHWIEKRDTVFVKLPPGCIFYECIARCRQRGFKSGGYCTINGCQCLR